MSEQQASPRNDFRDAPMPPPVSGGPYPLQLGHDATFVPRQTADYPINHHRLRTGQRRPVWPWLTLLGLTIVGALASSIVVTAWQPSDDPVGTIESVEVDVDDP